MLQLRQRHEIIERALRFIHFRPLRQQAGCVVEELGAGSEYTWLGVGAVAAAGAAYASRPGRRQRALAGPDGYDSVFARWEGADAAPPR